MEETKAKKKLNEIVPRWKLSKQISADGFCKTFKNTDKYTLDKQVSYLNTLIKPFVSNYDDIRKQFELDVTKNKKTPYDALIISLNNAIILPEQSTKPKIAAKPTSKASDFESPTLSSTRVEKTFNRRSDLTEVS
jgi:hypothetical protein